MPNTIETREKLLINTDPFRRCYNGAHFKSELVWSSWEVLESNINNQVIDQRLTFWKELNDYAVSQRGNSARREFRILKESEL